LRRRGQTAFVVPEKEKLSFEEKVTRIEKKILRDEEIFEFRLFVAEGFQLACTGNKRLLNSQSGGTWL
jgi:hypothetical protein